MTLIKVLSFRSVYDLRGSKKKDPINKLQELLIKQLGKELAQLVWTNAKWSLVTEAKFIKMAKPYYRKANKHMPKASFDRAFMWLQFDLPYAKQGLDNNTIYAELDKKDLAKYLKHMANKKFDSELEELLK